MGGAGYDLTLENYLMKTISMFTLYPILSSALSTSVAPLKNSTRLFFSSLSSAVIADLSVTNLNNVSCSLTQC